MDGLQHVADDDGGRALTVLMVCTRDLGAKATGRVTVLRTHAEALEALGHRLVVAVVAPAPPAPGGWSRRFRTVHVPAPGNATAVTSAARALLTRRSTLNESLFVDRSVRRRVGELVRAEGVDVVVLDSLRLSTVTRGCAVPAVVDLDDLLSERYRDMAGSGSGDPAGVLGIVAGRVPGPLRRPVALAVGRLLGWEAARARTREDDVTRTAAAVSLVSLHEVDHLRQRTGRPVHWLPPAVRVPEHPPTRRPGLVFLGGLDYRPNLEALRFHRDQVLPHLDAGDPEHLLHVVGHCPDELRAEFEVPGIEVLGFVPDLAEAMGRRLMVAPLASGGGIKVKVLDAMAHGIPVVGTPGAFTGLGAPPDTVRAADDGPGLARAVRELLDDPAACDGLAEAGRRHVAEHFTPASAARRWSAVLDEVGTAPVTPTGGAGVPDRP